MTAVIDPLGTPGVGRMFRKVSAAMWVAVGPVDGYP